MQSLQPLLAFAETARHGNFTRAARAMGCAKSTLAKAVARLELQLGVPLFHRSTRHVTLTPDGERLYQRCRRVLAEWEELQAEAASAEPAGWLRVDMPITYGKRHVMPLLAALARRHAGLRLDLRLSDRHNDLVRDGVDLAVRIGELQDSSLVARRVDHQHLLLCAAPALLAVVGVPASPDGLDRLPAIAFRLPTSGRDRAWAFRSPQGQPLEHHPAVLTRVDDTEGLVEAIRLGLGVCQLPDYAVDDDLARGTLVELLPAWRPAPMPISVVMPSGRLQPARVQAAVQALQALRDRLRWPGLGIAAGAAGTSAA